MLVVALEDNKTLKITGGSVYEACYMSKNLIWLENDCGDSLILPMFDFVEYEGGRV